ncbi:MAG: hypothetical protein WC627_04420 [Legionella sp.]|jgi:hypothetical protein
MKAKTAKEVIAQQRKFEGASELERLEMLFNAINLVTKAAATAQKKGAPVTLNKELTLASTLIPFAKSLIESNTQADSPSWAKAASTSHSDDDIGSGNPFADTLKKTVHLESLKTEAEEVFKAYAMKTNATALWDEADTALNTVINKLNPFQQQMLNDARDSLKLKLNNPFDSVEKKAAAFRMFAIETKGILQEVDLTLKQKVLKIAAVVLVTLLSASLGFLIGFLAGLATGPGALCTGVIAGSAAATAVLATTGISYAARDLKFFKSKEQIAVENYNNSAQVIEHLGTLKGA